MTRRAPKKKTKKGKQKEKQNERKKKSKKERKKGKKKERKKASKQARKEDRESQKHCDFPNISIFVKNTNLVKIIESSNRDCFLYRFSVLLPLLNSISFREFNQV